MPLIPPQSTIFEACQICDRLIPADFGGGASLSKMFLMSYLVQNQGLSSFAEIGVYRGRSFFPTAYSIHKNGGVSYAIDPYSLPYALEHDVEKELGERIKNFL